MIHYGTVSATWIEEDISTDHTVGKRLVRVEADIYAPPGRDIIRPGALAASGEMNASGPYNPNLHALLECRDPDGET